MFHEKTYTYSWKKKNTHKADIGSEDQLEQEITYQKEHTNKQAHNRV